MQVERVDAAASGRLRRRFDWLLIALFLAGITAPSIDALVRPLEERSTAEHEMRKVLDWPRRPRTVSDFARLPSHAEAWFKDRMGLRDQLLRLRADVRGLGFGVSPIDEADLTREGWTFLRSDGSREAWAGRMPASAERLAQWEAMLRNHAEVCETLDARYLFVLGPNKETIYPERVPSTWHKFGPTPLEQLSAWLAEHEGVHFLDLRPSLLAAKAEDRPDEREFLYYPLGTHWMPRGDHVAYRAIYGELARHFPGLSPIVEYSTLERMPFYGPGDTWAYRAFLEHVYTQPTYMMRTRVPLIFPNGSYGDGRHQAVVQGTDPRAPRAVLFHDSFGVNQTELLGAHFSRLQCVWSPQFDVALLLRERPDVVIELYVERFLVGSDPQRMHASLDRSTATHNVTSEPTFVLTRDDVARDVSAGAGLSAHLAADPNAILRLRLERDGGYVLLPRLPENSPSGSVVRIAIEAPADTVLALLPVLRGETEPRRFNPGIALLSEGRNDVIVRLPYIPRLDRFALRPGRVPGRYVISALEVRPETGEIR